MRARRRSSDDQPMTKASLAGKVNSSAWSSFSSNVRRADAASRRPRAALPPGRSLFERNRFARRRGHSFSSGCEYMRLSRRRDRSCELLLYGGDLEHADAEGPAVAQRGHHHQSGAAAKERQTGWREHRQPVEPAARVGWLAQRDGARHTARLFAISDRSEENT